MSKKILGIGNAIVDVLAKVDDEFLIKRKFIKGSMRLINKSEFEDLKKNIKKAHHLILLHGRYTCKARNPLCKKCVINKICLYKGKNE